MKVKTAIISVYDKTGVVEFAKELHKLNIVILSTGGTAKALEENNIPVIKIEDYTCLPEILDGRVKTLNYKIFGGILAKKDNQSHTQQLSEMKIDYIDMVIVNLYPFEKMMADPKLSMDQMIEYIDIGGNSLLRAAAKNYKFVLPIFSSDYYNEIIQFLKEKGDVPFDYRQNLAKETFLFTSYYDNLVTQYFASKTEKTFFSDNKTIFLEKKYDLRYGENPHQNAALYSILKEKELNYEVFHGKQLSFNNIVDFYAAANLTAELEKQFKKAVCVIVKHTNPCGVACSDSTLNAYKKALQSDPVSAFGGIVVFNKKLDLKTAKELNKKFYEIIIAKDYEKTAMEELKQKKNLRVIQVKDFSAFLDPTYNVKSYNNLLLIQEKDTKLFQELKPITKKKPTKKDIEELTFSWIICKHVKSNAIVLTKNLQVLGIGSGQTSRIDSTNFAAAKAKQHGFSIKSSYLASDAFFPFKDSVAQAAKYGVKSIIQPGGSVNDKEVFDEADKKKISMVLTGMRHFNH